MINVNLDNDARANKGRHHGKHQQVVQTTQTDVLARIRPRDLLSYTLTTTTRPPLG